MHSPTVGSWGGAVSYEQGTPVTDLDALERAGKLGHAQLPLLGALLHCLVLSVENLGSRVVE